MMSHRIAQGGATKCAVQTLSRTLSGGPLDNIVSDSEAPYTCIEARPGRHHEEASSGFLCLQLHLLSVGFKAKSLSQAVSLSDMFFTTLRILAFRLLHP